ncbi:hypothetical protein [Streptomyces microflavus]|uniref:Uncharacterized protein n=1 Tax=Streptomyces microflavus TaxID=1919 RepID=A0A7H8MQF6_STRMI|nr:hypothetical protein [Streptomyces microflavus]QKW44271.1 hypothetical protein HUT09_17960 [Streptomyces microflavus]
MSPTVVVSSIALVFSVASLSWQAWSWWWSGPIIKITGASDSPIFQGQQSDLGYHYIQVVNTGRAAATIEAFGVILPSGLKPIRYMQDDLEAVEPRALPYRLEPHSSARWYFTPQIFQGEEPAETRPFVVMSGKGEKEGKKFFS